jgi:glucose/arabinose dehydrogenase
MRTIRLLTAATCLVLLPSTVATAVASNDGVAAPAAATAIKVVPVKTGLNVPAAFTFSGAGNIWYLEKGTGEIHVLRPGTGKNRLFGKISNVDASGERGALGIALHPRFPATPYLYVYVTRTDKGAIRNELLRIRADAGHMAGFRVLFRWKVSLATNHNGGRILFGPDHKLWIVTGENANPQNSQVKTNLRGKILRMNGNGSIPKDNPFGTRIWSFGHRNSFGFTFDPKTGRLWETENGPECNDEINLIVKGGNFGWGPNETCSGAAPQDTNNSGPRPRHLPKIYFASTVAPTGAAFCNRCGLGPALNGDLVFGDYNTHSMRAVNMNAARTGFSAAPRILVSTSTGGVFSVEVGPRDRIYFSGPNGIYRLAAA